MATPQSDISRTTSASPNSEGVQDAVGIAAYDYAAKVGSLIKLVTDLRAIGYGSVRIICGTPYILSVSAQTDVDLPRIAVIGNQSAGKSSLVEAISGVCFKTSQSSFCST